jgi:Domain of unknown function (DUF4413)
LAWYKVTKDEDDILKTLDCKVPNCKKPYFVYKQSSGMTSFKIHVEMHQKRYRELEQTETQDKSLTPIVDAMKQKFLKYWEDISLLVIIANCLNPTYKNYYTIRMVQAYKENLHLSNTKVEAYVNLKFDEMFNIYNSKMVDNQNLFSSRCAPR